MHLKEALGIALQSMRSARLRTGLTMFGIIVGVAAVILLVGLGGGVRSAFNEQFGPLSTTIIIQKTTTAAPGANPSLAITEADMEALAKPGAAPSVSSITPFRNGQAVLRYEQREFRAGLAGVFPPYLTVRNRVISAGRMFTQEENDERARVIVLGSKAVDTLFGGDAAEALRSEIRVGRLNMRVVGVLKSAGDEQDGQCIVPLNSSRALFAGANTLNGIGVVANSVEEVPAALNEVNAVMDAQHDVRTPDQRDYSTQAQLIQLERVNRFIEMLTLFIAGVAGISLFVGALGIANIMLVTVNERTSEIGIRKAIGARESAIMKQFLTESTLLAAIGGLIGVGLGIGLTLLGSWLVPRYEPSFGAPEISWYAIGIAFGVSVLIGLLSGGAPAKRAAGLHPIEALRH